MPTHQRRSANRGPHHVARGRARILWIALVALLVIAAVAIVLLRSQNALPAEVDVTRAHQMYAAGALMLDVRTQAEFDAQRVPGSQLIPLDELPDRLNALPKDRDIVVVCRSGSRSKEGTTILRQAGFSRATCMSGGLQAWSAAGYPVEP